MSFLLIGGSAMAQVADPATYPAIPIEGTTSSYTLNGDWLYSGNTGNYASLGFTNPRTIAYKDGKVYMNDSSDPLNLYVFNADGTPVGTGKFALPTPIFEGATGVKNCVIRADHAGHLVLANLVTSMQTGGLQVWVIDDENSMDAAVKILEYKTTDYECRMDHINVYGDVKGDGYIMGAISGAVENISNLVYKWEIQGGVVNPVPEVIIISQYYPASITTNGTAPFVLPITDDLFYLDGSNSLPTLYKQGDTPNQYNEYTSELRESFLSAATAGTTIPQSTANGLADFMMGDDYYLVAGGNNHGDKTTKNIFYLYKLGAGGTFEGMQFLYSFPEAGLGTASNPAAAVVPVVNVVNETSAEIFIFANANGFGKYSFKIDNGNSIADMTEDNVADVKLVNGVLEFSDTVTSAEVYNLTGQQVAAAKNVSEMDAPSAQGVYIVKVTNQAGATKAQKVFVK
ncbi:MAG: T9SS type A sorting domain-containing protein [Dysgonomonas sp.]